MTVTEPSSLIPTPELDKQRTGSVPAKVLAREAIVTNCNYERLGRKQNDSSRPAG